jgi:predicted HAD superfamily Cof-like phosphohydrolase
METNKKKPKKVRTTLSITLEAQNIVFDHGYASERTIGEFVSRLIVEHHAHVVAAKNAAAPHTPTKEEIAAEMHRLADLLTLA